MAKGVVLSGDRELPLSGVVLVHEDTSIPSPDVAAFETNPPNAPHPARRPRSPQVACLGDRAARQFGMQRPGASEIVASVLDAGLHSPLRTASVAARTLIASDHASGPKPSRTLMRSDLLS